MEQYMTVTLTPLMSKRLIARGIAAMPAVKRAFSEGKIIISAGSTTAYLYAELTGSLPEREIACGIIAEKGFCIGKGMTDYLSAQGRAKYWFFQKGEIIPSDDLIADLADFNDDDIFIKGANAIDARGYAGILLGNPNSGGLVGQAIGQIMAQGITFIVPAGLEKMVQGSIVENARRMGIAKLRESAGMPVGLLPVSGQVFTEIDAFRVLTGADASHCASGGVAGAEGSVALLLSGTDKQLAEAGNIYRSIVEKGQRDTINIQPSQCAEHKWASCITKNMFYRSNVKRGL